MFDRIRKTIVRLYNSAILLILPEVETVLTGLVLAINFLERREAALERRIDSVIAAIVDDAKDHQNALDAVNRHYSKVNARNLSALGLAKKEAEAAVQARTAVEQLINRG